MAGISFTEGSGVNDSVFGNAQAPIRKFIEKRGEALEQQSMLPYLFDISESNNFAEMVASMTGMKGFEAVGENGEYPTDSMQESYSKTFVHVTWKNSFSLSREIIDDSKVMDLRRKPEAFVAGYYRTRECFGAALYASAMLGNTSVKFRKWTFPVTSADGVCLFNKSHPSITDSKLKQCNLFSDAFSDDALAAVETAMQNFKGDNGEVLDVHPDTILIPNNYKLKKAVFAAIGADKDPDTSNNGFNFLFGRWNVIVWPYLNELLGGDSNAWVLLDSSYNTARGGAEWFDRVNLEVRSEIASNDANNWKGYARFTAGFADWRFAAVGGVTGGTQLVTT